MKNKNLTYGTIPTTCFRTERPAFFHKGKRPVDTDVPIEKFIRQLSQTVQKDVFTIMLDGCPIKVHPKWIRDHIHEMKGYKHWESDMKDYLDLMITHQHPDGFFYEMVQVENEAHTKIVRDECVYFDRENGLALVRLELEADIEYLMVEGVYTVFQATGDYDWMVSVLPSLEKGIDYCTSHPKRWSPEYGLVIRPKTIDTWDFENRPDCRENRNIDSESVMGIMHGDNSGIYAAMMTLAKMNTLAGNHEKAESWKKRAEQLKANLDKYCWNGKFYQHMLILDPTKADPLESERLSLSNTYDMNRGITTYEQARSILSEYKHRRETTEAFCEWFTIDPPYPQFGSYKAGQYINGAIASLTAGELAKAAFQYGEEKYGWDILCRLMGLMQRDGELFFMYNPETGENAGGGPSGWGAAAILCAIEEGLAGVIDNGVCFDQMIFCPRWCLTDMTEVKYITGYQTSHVFVQTQYEITSDEMHFTVSAPSKQIQCHILLPDNTTASIVKVNGNIVPFEICTIGESTYIDFTVTVSVEANDPQRYQKNPLTDIRIIF